MKLTRRQFVLGTLAAGAHTHAQQLAHAGWRGNSIAPEAWWKHATFVRFPSDTTFAAISKSLDAMAEVSADSVLLPDLEPAATNPFAERFGTEEELDSLLSEVSARRMHVLLSMPLQRALSNAGEVRFWMTRGIAGFDLGILSASDMDGARALRASLNAFPGERILMARTPAAAENVPARTRKSAPRDPITLHVASMNDLVTGKPNPNTVLEIQQRSAPKVDEASPASTLPGAVTGLAGLLPLLLAPGAPVLDSRLLDTPQERADIRTVLAQRTSHPVLRNGTAYALATTQPDLHAWLVQGRSTRDALLLASNTGTSPLTLHLAAALSAHHIVGSYLRPLLRSDNAMGAVDVETGTLPPSAALLAEVRSDRYVAAPTTLDPDAPPPGSARHSRRRRRRR